MVGLIGTVPTPEAADTAAQWAALNHVRHLIVFSALLLALRTFALLYEQRGAERGR